MGFIHTNEVYGFGWSFLDGRIYTRLIDPENKQYDINSVKERISLLNTYDYSTANYMLYRKCYSTYDTNSTSSPHCFLWISTDINNFMNQLNIISK